MCPRWPRNVPPYVPPYVPRYVPRYVSRHVSKLCPIIEGSAFAKSVPFQNPCQNIYEVHPYAKCVPDQNPCQKRFLQYLQPVASCVASEILQRV